MTHAILRAPLKWVDTNPSGRILNRFTSDMFMVDRRLPGDLGNFLQSVFQLVVTIAASLSVSVYVIIAGAILMAFYARVASIYSKFKTASIFFLLESSRSGALHALLGTPRDRLSKSASLPSILPKWYHLILTVRRS